MEPKLEDIGDYDTLKGEKKKIVWTVIIVGIIIGIGFEIFSEISSILSSLSIINLGLIWVTANGFAGISCILNENKKNK